MHHSALHHAARRAAAGLVVALVCLTALLTTGPSWRAARAEEPLVDAAAATPPLMGVQKLVSGAYHRCALLSDHDVWCWGWGQHGTLGNGETSDRVSAVSVLLPDAAIDIAAGMAHTCAIVEGGSVWCWGSNEFGMLGIPGSGDSPMPVEVPGLPDASKIWAGFHSTCALTEADALWCWGYNAQGGLKPPASQRIIPTAMTGMAGVLDVAVSGASTCVILADDSVRCWGSDLNGSLGDGEPESIVTSADAVEPIGMTNVRDLAAGSAHTCAVRNGMFATSTWCWGGNSVGAAGPSPSTVLESPTKIPGLLTARNIDALLSTTCVVTGAKSTTCWGMSQGIDGDTDGGPTDPTTVVTAGASNVSVSALGSCVVTVTDYVLCRGINTVGTQGGSPGQAVTVDNVVVAPPAAYTPLDPIRLMDTHQGAATVDGQLAGGGAIAARTKVAVAVTGRPGVVSGGSTVVVRVRVNGAAKAGSLVVFPCSSKAPRATTVAFGKNAASSSTTTVRLASGRICLRSNRAVHVVVDLVGRQAIDDDLLGVRPARLWDTRSTGRTVDGLDQRTGLTKAGTPRPVTVLGRGGVPSTGVSAVLLSVTAGAGKAAGSFRVNGCTGGQTTVRSGSYRVAGDASVLVLTPVDGQGRVCVTTSSRTHVTLDVVGRIGAAGSLSAGTPAHVFDTRAGSTTDTGSNQAVGRLKAGDTYTISLADFSHVVPATATPSRAVFVTVTAIDPAKAGRIDIWPCNAPSARREAVVLRRGVTASSMAVLGASAGATLCIRSTVATDALVDIAGRSHW